MQIVDDGPEDAVLIQLEPGDSSELEIIVKRHLPEWLELFAKKNADYGGGSAFELGERGQYSDIHRKMIKLKRAMWDDKDLDFEGVDEIINDLIGHLFLTLYMRGREGDVVRPYAPSKDDVAVDAVFRIVGGVASRAYQMSYAMNPPFGEKVRARASKQMEDEAREEMIAQGVDPSISLEEATQRLRDAGMTNERDEPVLMARSNLLQNAVSSRIRRISVDAFAAGDAKQGGIHNPAVANGDSLHINGAGELDGDYTIVKDRSLRDDEDDPIMELALKFEELTTTPEQKAEVKAILDKLFKNSDKQRELLSRFERTIRGY